MGRGKGEHGEMVHTQATRMTSPADVAARQASHQAIIDTKQAYMKAIENALAELDSKIQKIKDANVAAHGQYASLTEEARAEQVRAEQEYLDKVEPFRVAYSEGRLQEAKRVNNEYLINSLSDEREQVTKNSNLIGQERILLMHAKHDADPANKDEVEAYAAHMRAQYGPDWIRF